MAVARRNAAHAPPPAAAPEDDPIYEENRIMVPLNVLVHLCPLLSFQELIRLREVCKYWKNVVTASSLYWDRANFIIDNKWVRDRGELYTTEMTRNWRTLTFYQYFFRGNLFSRIHWPVAQRNLTTVIFKEVTLSCDRMTKIVSEIRNLAHVEFINVHYPAPLERNGQGRLSHRIFCGHTDLRQIPLHGGGGEVVPRIRKIVSRGHPVIPNCMMLILSKHSRGTLQEFELSRALREDQDLIIPTVGEHERQIAERLLIRNPIRELTLLDNTSSLFLLSKLQMDTPRLALEKISLAQRGNDIVQTQRIMDFLMWQQPKQSLRSVDLQVNPNWDVDVLAAILQRMNVLQTLKLSFGPREGADVDLSFLARLNTLQELEVSVSRFAQGGVVNPAYIPGLPPNLRTLYLDPQGITEAILVDFIQNNPTVQNLLGLHVIKGAGVTNAVMGLIIQNMPSIEKLSINDSMALTDSGLTGWPQKTVDFILHADCYGSAIHGREDPNGFVGPSIKELTHLRFLSLRRCMKVSDISVIRGIQLPHLREIDVSAMNITDLGMMWLCHNNPGIEKITCKQNGKISRFGLNQVITSFPSIRKICSTKATSGKELGNIDFENSPRFSTVITMKN